jgi:hypothetical protein
MGEELFGLGIATVAVVGGFGIAVYAMWLDGKKRQLRHIERMAMIEKGIAPPALMDSPDENGGRGDRARRGQRRGGVLMICLGIGLAIMFGLKNGGWEWGQVWIGAFIAMFGVANLLNAWFDGRESVRSTTAGRNSEPQPR